MRSKRQDARGHWPAGKRRHPDKGNWSAVRLQLARFLDTHWSPGEVSNRALAAELGVSDRSVRRWVTGEDRPPVETQEAIEQWIVEWRAEIKRRGK